MDEETIDWVLSDRTIDPVSGIPLSAIVFMLYYGFELKHFFLNISDVMMTRYPMKLYDVGRSSVYLAGSCGHGFFLNSLRIIELRDFDIVTILRKYDVRKKCHHDEETLSIEMTQQDPVLEYERDREFCSSNTQTNTTCSSDTAYMNVEQSDRAGYVLLRKCRRNSISQASFSERYVSSAAVMNARFYYWDDAKMHLKQRYKSNEETYQTSAFGFDDTDFGPILSFVHTQGPAVNAYLTDRWGPRTTTLNTDIVIALPYPDWPSEANEWKTRVRHYGWPSDEVRGKIENTECLLVPVGHHTSPMQEFQWRISFSRAEMILSRSFSRVQRELVHIMKSLHLGGSYHILNTMFYLSEETAPGSWVSKNIASLMFKLLDRYKECLLSRKLPHYFMSEVNVLEKYEENASFEEKLDSALFPIYELRLFPLERLLNQVKHLSLPEKLHRRVFSPFVQEVKENRLQSGLLYVDTIVRLAKAHLQEENLLLAYRYSQDALQFMANIDGEAIPTETLVDVHLTVAVCSYLSGETTPAIQSLALLESFLGHEEGVLGKNNIFGRHRGNYYMLYGRISSIHGDLETAKTMYIKAIQTLIPDTTVFLDSINFLKRIGEVDEVSRRIDFLSAYLLPNIRYTDEVQETNSFAQQEIDPQPIANDGAGEDGGENGSPERGNIEKNTSKEHETTNENPGKGNSVSCTSTEQRMELDSSSSEDEPENIEVIYSRTGQTMTSIYDEQTSHVTESSQTSHMTETAQTSHVTETAQTSHVTETAQTSHVTEITSFPDQITDEQFEYNDARIHPDIANLDAYYVKRVHLAKKYEAIGMEAKSLSILENVKQQLALEHPNPEYLFPLIIEASKSFDVESHFQVTDTYDFNNVFRYNFDHLVYSMADEPVMDDILRSVMQRKKSIVKISHVVALLHFKIEHYKMLHQFDKAMKVISELECVCEDLRGDSRWLLGFHLAYFGQTARAKRAFVEAEPRNPHSTVEEEIVSRVDQLMTVVKGREIRNAALDDVFQ